jgi:uncharacterized DUF497 family protein
VAISSFIWPDDRIEHVARHGIQPEEVEEACFGRALVLAAEATGPNPVYHVLGETDAGRQLFCVVILFPGEKAYPVTARDMTEKEKRRYREWKRR